MGSLGLGLGGLALRRHGLAPAWTPAKLPAPAHGGWWNISNAASVTTSGGNITSVADSFGSARALTATAAHVPIGTDAGTGAKYAEIRAANLGTTYPGLSGSVMATGSNAPWTVTFILRWIQGPSSSSSSIYTSFGYLGGSAIGGASGSPVLFAMGPTNVYGSTNSTSVNVIAAGQGVWSPFGRETLASGSSGATIPSTQVATIMYDGSTLSLWIDGVLQPTQSGGNGGTRTGMSITLDSAMLATGAWYNLANAADRDLYEVLAVDYAMTPTQIKQVAAYAQKTYGIAQTADKYTFLGDSIEAGSASSSAATAYNALLPQILSAALGYPMNVANMAITSTTCAAWINSAANNTKFNNFDWQVATYAMGYSPMARANYAGVEWGVNDAGLVNTATFEAQDAQVASILRGWGVFKKLLRTNILPCDATCLANFSGIATNRTTWNAYMRAAVGTTWDAILDWDSADTTPLPGVSAWSSTQAYTAPANGGPPWLVTFGGTAYFALANSTNVTPGTDGTKWVALDGSGATFAAMAATLVDGTALARYSDHLHLGTNGAQGDLGPAAYGYAKAIPVARMLGLV